jgi:hypothetical protein
MQKKILFYIISCFCLTSTFSQKNKLDGVYIGLEPMCWTLKDGTKECYSDPARPKRKWFHLTYFKIQGDTIFADQSHISIYKKDTLHSSSDGAFFYYHGHINLMTRLQQFK